MTVLGRSGRGDQIVEIVVKVPEKLSREEKKLYESLLELTNEK
jgi:DnaJ-class molecular chaperone